eukprot:Rhum_TRINITY_DN23354_c0_g1::Rhum_TRINITY_DN23354_c0_g1_i1::g.177773::m.177773
MQRAGVLRRTRGLQGYYKKWFDDEAQHRMQFMQMNYLPDRQLFLDKGTHVERTQRLCVNTDGSVDIRNYELFPLDAPSFVIVPKDCDRMSWTRDVMKKRAIMSGVSTDDME